MESNLMADLIKMRDKITHLEQENECRKSECDLLINSNKSTKSDITAIRTVLMRLERDIDDLEDR